MDYNNYAQNSANLKAKQSAFAFVAAEKTYNNCFEKLKNICEGLGGKKPSGYQIVISIMTIALCIILAMAEASNCQQALQGIGGFSETTALLMGWAASAIGLLAGHSIQKGIQKDEFSGSRTFTWQFYFGVILGVLYIGFQFFLSKSAGAGDSSLIFYQIYVVIICLLTILVGFMLQSSIQTLAYLVTRLRQRISYKKMWNTAKRTDSYWLRYLFDLNKSASTVHAEESTSIKRARDFYNGNGETTPELQLETNSSLN